MAARQDIPETVTIDTERLRRMCSMGFTTLRYVSEILEEPKGELQAQRQQQRVRERFLELLDELQDIEPDDFTLPWEEDVPEDEDDDE